MQQIKPLLEADPALKSPKLVFKLTLVKIFSRAAVTIRSLRLETLPTAFYTRTILPADHDDIMPPKGDPLTASEKAALKEWIDSGLKWTDGVVLKRKE